MICIGTRLEKTVFGGKNHTKMSVSKINLYKIEKIFVFV